MNDNWILFGCILAGLELALFITLFAFRFAPRKVCKVFALAAIGLTLYAGTKPRVTMPPGVADDGSCFDTNAWQWVEFRWKLQRDYPLDVLLVFDAKTGTNDWFNIGAEFAGMLTNRIDLTDLPEHPTNYVYRITSEYVPGAVEIRDFSAAAQTNRMAVVCRWTAPSQLVGLQANVQSRIKFVPVAEWTTVSTVTIQETNEVEVSGNFVNRRLDREFRVVVEGYSPFTLINLADGQYEKRQTISMLNFRYFTLPKVKREIFKFYPISRGLKIGERIRL